MENTPVRHAFWVPGRGVILRNAFCARRSVAHAAISEATVSKVQALFRLALLALFLGCGLPSTAEDAQKEELTRQYQSAVADYQAGRYAQAAEQLEKLLPYAPQSYEIH